ncbi:hypothetical protein [Allonocardiopsis opalescens]|uniref:Uncharacterized protein n=1 Tax=Allonocardiopsis opalescens TaxID=1144618 RepID=A0A2T0PWY1_9ACTN|nr:hypothetical protein [Allonocardiopsis opalescens]PRX96031.1 hypothetical protein CLV72_10835 [Allonocardiopsis opalescens]
MATGHAYRAQDGAAPRGRRTPIRAAGPLAALALAAAGCGGAGPAEPSAPPPESARPAPTATAEAVAFVGLADYPPEGPRPQAGRAFPFVEARPADEVQPDNPGLGEGFYSPGEDAEPRWAVFAPGAEVLCASFCDPDELTMDGEGRGTAPVPVADAERHLADGGELLLDLSYAEAADGSVVITRAAEVFQP